MKIFGIFGKFLFISIALCNLSFLRVYSDTNNQNKKIININENYLYFNPENNYKLGHGDQISIQIDDIPELSTIHVIDEKGTIYLSDLDRIYVRDLTTSELKELLNIEYSKYVYDPKINVNILSYRPVRVYIKGEIQNPGYINLNDNTEISSLPQITSSLDSLDISTFFPTLYDVIKVSGGITEFADLSNVEITRRGKISDGNKKENLTIDFLKMILSPDLSKNFRIFDGDVITIKKSKKPLASLISKSIISELNPKTISVLVTGRVRRPGKIEIGRQSVLSDAIEIAGGARVIRGKTKLVRSNNDGTTTISKIRYRSNKKRGARHNPNLKNGDIIIVGSSLLSNSSEVINEVTSPFVGLYGTYRIFDDIFE